MSQVCFPPRVGFRVFFILLGPGYGSVDVSSGQQILTSDPKVQFFFNPYQFELKPQINQAKISSGWLGSSK